MPKPVQPEAHEADRSPAERRADRAVIASSISELLPILIAKLGATGLAELEVRQDGLRVRLRRPLDGGLDQQATGRGDRATRGIAGANPAPHAVALTPAGPGREARDGRDGRDSDARDDGRAIATSPAVGIYQPRAGTSAGTRVRAGDRIGTVDMLGVLQEVVAPTDGLVGASLVQPGDAVEYGQGVVVIEFASAPPQTPATET